MNSLSTHTTEGFIWLIGCRGMLGTEIARQLTSGGFNFVGTDREVDITDCNSLDSFMHSCSNEGKKIAWIINCAAYTAVEKAEEDAERAAALNDAGARNIAKTARKHGAVMIHISTDYVFDGTAHEPYTEDMIRRPLGVYGATKAAGECAVQEELSDYYILRTAWLFGFDGPNFVYTMVKLMNNKPSLKVVNDQWGTPTCAVDLASVILTILKQLSQGTTIPAGIYHCTNEGQTNWFEFASEIYRLGKKCGKITADCSVLPCTTKEYGAKVARPAYSVLSKTKIQKTLGITLPVWQESLESFLSNSLFCIK